MAKHEIQLNYKKNDLHKMTKNALVNIITTKMNVTLEGKYTKSTLIKDILEYHEKTTKQNKKVEKKKTTKNKRGRKTQTKINKK